MDLEESMCFDGPWTDEKHSNFLSLVEASFVRRMFDQSHDHDHPLLKCAALDDTFAAKLSFRTRRWTRNRNNAQANSRKLGTNTTRDARKNRKKRKGDSGLEINFEDQVVPQLEDLK